MTELIGLSILEQIRLLTPYFVYGGILFIALFVNTLFTIWLCKRRMLRTEKERLPEITRRKLNDRDKLIASLRSHIDNRDKVIERYSVTIKAASIHNHKVSEILQLPMVNEVVHKKREAG